MYKLGLHVGHNSSCALMKDGEIIYIGQEERFCRIKNVMEFPYHALKYGLAREGITGSDIDEACYTTIVGSPLLTRANQICSFSIRDYYDYYGDRFYGQMIQGNDCTDYYKWMRDDEKFNKHPRYFDYSYLEDDAMLTKADECADLFREESIRFLSEEFGIPRERISHKDHHKSHAHYAYFASPFRGEGCAIIVLDGWGDGANQTVWKAENEELVEIARSKENDIGRVYKMATLLLGMRPDEHEYKVMGLAPYAKDSYIDKAYEALAPLSKIEDMKILKNKRPDNLFEYLKEQWIDKRFDNIGGAVQRFSEEVAVALIKDVHKHTGLRRFVISGGISMNVKMNKTIAELDCVDEFFVCGSGADESLSVGGCYIMNNGGTPMKSQYMGYDAADELESPSWDDVRKEFDVVDDISYEEIAKILAGGEVVARISGCAEFGARALGNRSILADPSRKESVYRINEAIKARDFWMPFALSILEEEADDYIENPKGIHAPYMSIAFDTKPEKYAAIQGGTHPYDKTVRPQFVMKSTNPGYHAIISAFKDLTGTPALLNTSFNLHGEPIVNDLKDALHTLRDSGLNYLLYENKLIKKRI